MKMKRITRVVTFVLIVLFLTPAPSLVVAQAEQQQYSSSSYTGYAELRWNFEKGSKKQKKAKQKKEREKQEDQEANETVPTENVTTINIVALEDGTYEEAPKNANPNDQPVTHGVWVSGVIAQSWDTWKEFRIGGLYQISHNWSVGAEVRRTVPDEGVDGETQFGPIFQYSTFQDQFDLTLRVGAYYGSENTSGLKRTEAHLFWTQRWGQSWKWNEKKRQMVCEQMICIGSATRLSFITEPENGGTWETDTASGTWETESTTVEGRLDVFAQIRDLKLQPGVFVEGRFTSTTGESSDGVNTFSIDENQTITRGGLAARYYSESDNGSSVWWQLSAGAENITDDGMRGDHTGSYFAAGVGFTF